MKAFNVFHEDFGDYVVESHNMSLALDEYAQEQGYRDHRDMVFQLGWYESELQVEEL